MTTVATNASVHPAPDLAVAWIAGAMVDTLFTTSLVDLFRHPQTAARIGAHLPYTSGPHLSVARTDVARMFLDTGLPWLLHLDSDMTFTPADMLTLLDAADPVTSPVIGGLYVGAVPAARVAPVLEPARLTPQGIVPLSSAPRGVVAVDFCGTGSSSPSTAASTRRCSPAIPARCPGTPRPSSTGRRWARTGSSAASSRDLAGRSCSGASVLVDGGDEVLRVELARSEAIR